MTDIKLADDQLNAIIVKAIMDSMTPERREELLTNAIKTLLDKPRENQSGGGYGNRDTRTVLQIAFDDATRTMAEKIIREDLGGAPDFKDKVRALFADVAERVFNGPKRDAMIEHMSEAVIKGLRPRDY